MNKDCNVPKKIELNNSNNKLHRAFSLIELSIVILIIGIIAAGITQSSRLVQQFRLATAKSLTKGSPIPSIKGLSVWFETTTDESFVEADASNGSSLTAWFDINPQSVIKASVTSTGFGTTVPTYKLPCINNLPCVNMTGGANNTITASNNVLPASSAGPTMVDIFSIIVVMQKAGSSTGSVIYTNSGTTGSGSIGFNMASATSVALTKAGTAQTAVVVTDLTTTSILEFAINNGAATLYQNGVSLGSAGASLGSGLSPSGVFGGGFSGHLAEIIMVNRILNSEERQDVVNYLKKKWAIK